MILQNVTQNIVNFYTNWNTKYMKYDLPSTSSVNDSAVFVKIKVRLATNVKQQNRITIFIPMFEYICIYICTFCGMQYVEGGWNHCSQKLTTLTFIYLRAKHDYNTHVIFSSSVVFAFKLILFNCSHDYSATRPKSHVIFIILTWTVSISSCHLFFIVLLLIVYCTYSNENDTNSL